MELEKYLAEAKEEYKQKLPYLIKGSNVIKKLADWLKDNLEGPYTYSIFKFSVRLY